MLSTNWIRSATKITLVIRDIILKLNTILLLALVIHSSYIFNSFTWLDHGDIESKRSVLSINELPKAFTERFGITDFYRPVVTIVNSFDYFIYDNVSYGYHFTNVLIHIGIVWMTYHFLQTFFRLNKNEALLGSLITAVHPLSWLPVGAISYRPELLMSFFVLASVILHIKARKSGGLYVLITPIVFLASLFSKETSLFLLPALLLLWEFSHFTSDRKNYLVSFKKSIVLFISESFSLVIYLLLRLKFVGDFWDLKPRSLSVNSMLATRIVVFTKQLVFLLSPLKPSLSDATRIYKLTDPTVVLIVLTNVLVLALIIKTRKKLKDLLFVCLFFILALVPSLNIILLPRFTSPHYSYFATVGIGCITAYIWRANKISGKILIAAWVIIASSATFFSGFLFKNDKVLFEYETRQDDNFLEGHYYLGNYYLKEGDFEKASFEYEKIFETSDKYISYIDIPSLYINYAAVKLEKGDYQASKELLNKVLDMDYQDINVVYNLALVEWKLGNYQNVVELLEPHLNEWSRPEPLILLSKAYLKVGNEDKVSEMVKKIERFQDAD